MDRVAASDPEQGPRYRREESHHSPIPRKVDSGVELLAFKFVCPKIQMGHVTLAIRTIAASERKLLAITLRDLLEVG